MPVAPATIQFMHYVKKIAANVPMNQIGIILWVDACISVRRLREPRLMMPMLSAKLEECDMALCWGAQFDQRGSYAKLLRRS